MEIMHKHHRTTAPEDACLPRGAERTDIVRQGMRLQKCIGTIGAIEYLKLHGVSGAVIARVLSGRLIRHAGRVIAPS